MCKRILRAIFVFLALITAFSNSYAKHKDRSIDKFVEEFVKSKNNPKIEYDGKTITINACASQRDYVFAVIFACFIGLIDLACLTSGEEGAIMVAVFITVVLGSMLGIILGYNLYHDLKNISVISINDKEVESSDLRYFKWKNVDRVNVYETSGSRNDPIYTHIHLCDKFLNPIFKISFPSAHLPVSADNLAVLLNHYLKKSRELANKNPASGKANS